VISSALQRTPSELQHPAVLRAELNTQSTFTKVNGNLLSSNDAETHTL